jgi:hypothetical protein
LHNVSRKLISRFLSFFSSPVARYDEMTRAVRRL